MEHKREIFRKQQEIARTDLIISENLKGQWGGRQVQVF